MEINQRMVAVILLIIVLVVVILFIIHAMKIKKIPGNGGRVHVHGTYIVTVGPKTQVFSSGETPSAPHGKCFHINGMEAPKLHLMRGVYYEFKNESDEPLYFSSSSEGGPGAPRSLAKNQSSSFIGLSNGTIFFMVTEDLPDSFYYQSGRTRGMGGVVQVR